MKNTFYTFLWFAIILFMFLSSTSFSQPLTGVKTIPGNYASIADAITALNSNGIGSGGVTFNISANYTETFPSPLSGIITATGTLSDPVVFIKSGSGANPLITSGVGTNAATDGIIVIAGGDYITFDGIDIKDNPANLDINSQMEWGYALLKASATAPINGCQNVTIKNCTINLNRTNTATKGIYCNNHVYNSTTPLIISATTDAANNNKFYSNTINNCYMGFWVLGFNAGAPYSLYDQNNDIGSQGGNIITNFGGSTIQANGIATGYQNNLKVNNNSVTSVSSGHTNTLYGLWITTATSANGEIIGNTITVTSSGTSGSCAGIYCTMGSTAAGNIMTFANNTIQNCSYPNPSTSGLFGIVNLGTPYQVNIFGNTIANNAKGSNGTLYCLQTGTSTISNIYNNNIYNNTLGGGTGTIYGFYNVGNSIYDSIYNNNIYNLTHNGTGTIYGIYLNSTVGVKNIFNNVINGLTTGGVNVVACSVNVGSPLNFFKNHIYNITSNSASGVVYGINSGAPSLNMYNNYIYDLKAPFSASLNAISGIYIKDGTAANLFYNTVYLNGVSSSATTFGSSALYVSTNPALEMKNNIFVNTSTPLGGAFTTAYRRTTSTISTHSSLSNRNDFYAGTPGINSLIFYDGTNSDQTISEYKARVVPADSNSFTEMPPFITINNNPCRISLSAPTALESGGMPVTPFVIGDDFFGNARNGVTPDVGAEEFSGTLLPVELSSFTCKNYERDVLLSWETKTEINALKFVIEKKSEELNWQIIGEVAASGNSSNTHAYSFIEKGGSTGKSSYRLKMIDFDGSFEYSKIIEADAASPNQFQLNQNYPNPFNPATKIEYQLPYNSNVSIEVYSVTGQKITTLVNSAQSAGYYSLDFNAGALNLSSGIYFYKIKADNSENKPYIQIRKMMLLK